MSVAKTKFHKEGKAGFIMDSLRSHIDRVPVRLAVLSTKNVGLGVFALEDIPAGKEIVTFVGHRMTMEEYMLLPDDLKHFPHQIEEGVMFGPTNIEEVGIAERINHSCNPNSGFISELKIVAMRSIKKNEEITLDYAFSESFSGYSFQCMCESSECRGRMTSDDWRNPKIYVDYFDFFQPYLKEKISTLLNYIPCKQRMG